MERLRSLMVAAALAVVPLTGCMTPGSKSAMKLDSLNKTLKEALPASTATPAASKSAPATQFAAAWQTKLGQLPDPTKNGVMNRGIVGQAFLYTDALAAADITGTLTVVANDSTDRTSGAPPKQPNVWHFDCETLKRMVVNDDRFGKSIALFLPWPEEWNDVNRLYIQARYDQPAAQNSHTVFAPPASVTLDLFSTGPQTTHSQFRGPAGQLAVPDPKLLIQNSKGGAVPPATNPIQQAGYGAAWPTNVGAPPSQPMNGATGPANIGIPPNSQPSNGAAWPAIIGVPPSQPSSGAAWPGNVGVPPAVQQPGGETKEFQRKVISRN